jgi:hypothetical protein
MTDIIFKKEEIESLVYKLKGWKETGIESIDLFTTTMFFEDKLKGGN